MGRTTDLRGLAIRAERGESRRRSRRTIGKRRTPGTCARRGPVTAYACGRDAWSHQSGWRIEMNAEGITRRHWPSVAGCVYSEDRGRSWHAGALADGMENGNETTVAQLADGGLLFCCRNMNADRCRVLTVRYSATRDRAGTGSRTWIHSARTSTSPCARGERRSAQAELAAYCRRAHGRYH